MRRSLGSVPAAALAVAVAAGGAGAQSAEDRLAVLRLEATPIGALPPIAMPMPASRNHNYWGARLQVGQRLGRSGTDLQAIAGGIDLQWRGGSIFGATAGYQARDCTGLPADCGGHLLFGVRGRFNIITGGPSIATVLGDYSATTTVGAEAGFGFAPDVTEGDNACTVDLGVPLAVAMLQRVRLVPFVTPAVVWDVDCSDDATPTTANFVTNIGVGIQQVGLRGLDVYLGFQKIFRTGTGYHFGLSVTYVRLP